MQQFLLESRALEGLCAVAVTGVSHEGSHMLCIWNLYAATGDEIIWPVSGTQKKKKKCFPTLTALLNM